ncbi:MAG: M20/M25/M40 family metallo-hydrolase [Pirellulales bacterium]|nr:M20/M25/M40 family metallo-hydrolase [Pirellulales bacterium]
MKRPRYCPADPVQHRHTSPGGFALRVVLLGAISILPALAQADEKAEAIEKRLADSSQYLASDELEGRGIGTKGIDLAADYIARQFGALGLKTDLFDGGPFQGFTLTTSAKPGQHNRLSLVGAAAGDGQSSETVELRLDQDFSPMVASGDGRFDLPLVFVGYGITAEKEGYDDYAGVDAEGKAAVILRHEPQQNDPESVFDGTKDSEYAPFHVKISNAFDHGAAGIVFCTDQFEIGKGVQQNRRRWQKALDRLGVEHEKFKEVEDPTLEQIESQRQRIEELMRQVETLSKRLASQYDPVLPFRAMSDGADPRPGCPVVHCRRAVLDRIFTAALGSDLTTLERQIDEGPAPRSRELGGWRAVGQTEVLRETAAVKNVVAVLPGEGPLAKENVVIGAHYDHVGFGRQDSAVSDERTVYNGADDNASGVAVMIEVARSLAEREEKLLRSVVFIAFTAEERGLLGSAHYVNHPPIPLGNTVAMLNLDMVGRLRDDKLTVFGSGTAPSFGALLDRTSQDYDLALTKKPSGFGPSDHTSFYTKEAPVMHFFTGTHEDLHRPSDDFEKLNVPGMRRVGQMIADVAVALANAQQRPQYVAPDPPR